MFFRKHNDKLKSITRRYGSFDYDFDSYDKSDIVKLEIRVNEEPVGAFSFLVYRSKAEGKIIAKETVSAITKNVTAKCYGGGLSRKQKPYLSR